MRQVNTFQATICLGLREGYDGAEHSVAEVEEICQEFCNNNKVAVTVTPTKYIYVGGHEKGCFIGFINYPRFPEDKEAIRDKAIELARILRKHFNQFRVSVMCSDKIFLIED